jgi:TIR domain
MPEGAIFVSYAHEDLAAAKRMKTGLDVAGITVWFDMDRLGVGDDYDRKIQGNIGHCSFFIPLISATTERRVEGYFRREWHYALDRARNIADHAVFIIPVAIDDTLPTGALLVPERFRAAHWERLLDGVVTSEFAQRLRVLMGKGEHPSRTSAQNGKPMRIIRGPAASVQNFTVAYCTQR